MRRALLLALLPAMAQAQVTDERLLGTFAADCAEPQSDLRIAIAPDRIAFHESVCTLSDPVPVEGLDGAVLLVKTCTGEGETWAGRMLLMPAMEGGVVRVESGLALTYSRCE